MYIGVLLYVVCVSINKYLVGVIIRDISFNIKRYFVFYEIEKKKKFRYMYIRNVYELKLF